MRAYEWAGEMFKSRVLDIIRHYRLVSDEEGSVLIIVAAALPTLVVLASLIVDMAYVTDRTRRLQLAADTAAYAGATYVPIYGPGYSNLGNMISAEVTAQINTLFAGGQIPNLNPQPSLDSSVYPYTVTVNLTESVSGVLLSAARMLVGSSDISSIMNISVHAKARALLAGKFCWLALSPSAAGAVSFNGSVTVGTPTGPGSTCGIAVNSNSSDAMDSRGSAVSINVPISVVGGYQYTGNPPPMNLNYSYPVPDPYQVNGTRAAIQSMSNAKFGASGNITGSGTVPTTNAVSGAHYTNFSSGNTVLPSGTYYVDNLSMSGNSSITTAPGASVTVILSPSATVSMGKNNTFTIDAPSSGALAGIGITSMGSMTAYMYGNPSFSGALYFPNGSVAMGGNFSSNCMQIISQTISISGNPTVDDSACPQGSQKVQRFLVGLTQ